MKIPSVIFGTSCLGNLYKAMPYHEKIDIVKEFFKYTDGFVMLDSAGKYGAGLALESIGSALKELQVPVGAIRLSNKLGWLRVPLKTSAPTFEPGVWKGLENDAIQEISYDGILKCWKQGNEFLGIPYKASFVSIHDPDEYLNNSTDASEKKTRFKNILGAYKALHELKKTGEADAVGVGAKDWRIIKILADEVELDWVMFACSLTVMNKPKELLNFIAELKSRGVTVINSAVFHSGFLTGGKFFDYRIADPLKDKALFNWREYFFSLCRKHDISPAAACVRFGMTVPGVTSVALNTSNPKRVKENVEMVKTLIPDIFWTDMKEHGLLNRDFPYAG